MPKKEQNLVDLCGKWKIELEKPANITAYRWAQTEVTATLGTIDAF
jgi:hypothetical protein